MKLTGKRPPEAFWLVLNLVLLAMIVAVPAVAWAALEAITYGRVQPF